MLEIGHALLGRLNIRSRGATEIDGNLPGVDLRKELPADAKVQSQRSHKEQADTGKHEPAPAQRPAKQTGVETVQVVQGPFDRQVNSTPPALPHMFLAGMGVSAQPLG